MPFERAGTGSTFLTARLFLLNDSFVIQCLLRGTVTADLEAGQRRGPCWILKEHLLFYSY